MRQGYAPHYCSLVSLRTRVTVIVVVGLVLMLGIGAFVAVQFRDVVITGMSIRDRLAPASALADKLVLERTSAGGAISDVVLMGTDATISDLSTSLKESSAALDAIDTATEDPALQNLITSARTAQDEWVKIDVTPVLAALAEGKAKKAKKITESQASWDAYNVAISTARALQTAIDEKQRDVTDRMSTFVKELAATLLLGALVLLGALAGLWFALRGWVIDPLQRLQDDLRVSADRSSHEVPISPSGPPEIRAVGADAESMRRQLVAEIDEARSAREALEQDAPLVAAVRAELAVASEHELSGFEIHGELQSAEGVLAGDWWDCIPLSDGRTGIVIADVSGHGAAAGVTALRTRTMLRQDLLEGNSPAHAIAEAADSWSDDGTFVTAVVMIVHPDGKVVWANAGHHPPRLMCQWAATDLAMTGPLLSSLGGSWSDETQFLKHGDLIVAYTDGLIESRDTDGDDIGAEWVTSFIEERRTEDISELCAQLIAAARNKTVEWHRDDVTLVAIRRI